MSATSTARSTEARNKVWQCPFCGYAVADIEFMSIIVNVDCPDCRRTRFSEFNSRPTIAKCRPRMGAEELSHWKVPDGNGGWKDRAYPPATREETL